MTGAPCYLHGVEPSDERAGARVKVCGVTSVDDALACEELGVDAIGLNFWDESKRRCTLEEAARIVARVHRVRVVGVFVDADLDAIEQVRGRTGIRMVQLHGSEPPALLEALLPEAMKAVAPAREEDVEAALGWPGHELVVDACVPGVPGGTGQLAAWSLAARIARGRAIWLAGGLSPDNVAAAIAGVRPYGVDVASGVERAPGVKDRAKLERFVRAARA